MSTAFWYLALPSTHEVEWQYPITDVFGSAEAHGGEVGQGHRDLRHVLVHDHRSIAVDRFLHVYGTPFFIDGQLEARREGLDFVRGYRDFGLNAVFVENYWNDGAVKDEAERMRKAETV